VAKMVRKNLTPQEDQAKKSKMARTPTVKPSGPAYELIDELSKSVKEQQLLDLVYLFSQRLALVLEAPDAVRFQANYQSIKFDNTSVKGVNQKDYMKEEEQYNTHSKAGKLSEIPNNFHNAHSGIKDRLSIWTRIHMDDLIRHMVMVDKHGVMKNQFLKEVEKVIKKYCGPHSEVFPQIIRIVHEAQPDSTQKHEPVPFLSEHPGYIDLRQDTLREIKEINGRPWVLVEIRDLKDTTLLKLIELAKDPESKKNTGII
jgi:hypothetical protein